MANLLNVIVQIYRWNRPGGKFESSLVLYTYAPPNVETLVFDCVLERSGSRYRCVTIIPRIRLYCAGHRERLQLMLALKRALETAYPAGIEIIRFKFDIIDMEGS